MLLTEEEARNKWCPMVRQAPSGTNAAADQHRKEYLPRCIASDCMMWRFVNRTHSRGVELWSRTKGTRVNSAYGDDAEWRPVRGSKDDPPPAPVGFCGLSGKPES